MNFDAQLPLLLPASPHAARLAKPFPLYRRLAQGAEELEATGHFRPFQGKARKTRRGAATAASGSGGEGGDDDDDGGVLFLQGGSPLGGLSPGGPSLSGGVPEVDSETGLLRASPLGAGAASEREAVCEQLWRKVYRALYIKT